MKYLLVLAVIVIAIHVWRRNRREEMAQSRPPPRSAPPAVGPPQDMVRCAHCGLHLPKAEAIAGSDGDYCSAAHRRAGPARS